MFDLTGKTAVVTGGSSGLGVQFAHALARQGAQIALIARREDLLKQVADQIRSESRGRCAYYVCDVTRSDRVAETALKIEEDFGRIDIAVNCAGGGNCDWTANLTDEKWHATMNVNLNGVFYCCREFGKIMLKNKYGRMINIASILGNGGMDVAYGSGIAEYAASKGAVINLTRQLAVEWAADGVTVNALSPGFFASEVSPVGDEKFDKFLQGKCPMKREGHPGELDAAIVFLASDEGRYMTGQNLFVDGGWTAM